MENVCPNCKGNAFLLTTGSDGRTMMICKECETYIPAAPANEMTADRDGLALI